MATWIVEAATRSSNPFGVALTVRPVPAVSRRSASSGVKLPVRPGDCSAEASI
jgi:hypothetical protein